jgi:predicted RNase H-like nuclease (RuvC/YqgF family)
MRLDELYTQSLPERKSRDEGEPVRYTDPELARTLAQASVKYPYYKTGQEGFMKYVQRGLKNSEEQSQQQSQEIEELRDEIEQLKKSIQALSRKG